MPARPLIRPIVGAVVFLAASLLLLLPSDGPPPRSRRPGPRGGRRRALGLVAAWGPLDPKSVAPAPRRSWPEPPDLAAVGGGECDVAALVAAMMASDPERDSLQPHLVRREGREHVCRGLDLSLLNGAFGSRRVLMMGDSTLRNLYVWTRALLLLADSSPGIVDGLPRLSLGDASSLVEASSSCPAPVTIFANCLGKEVDDHSVNFAGGAVSFTRTVRGVRSRYVESFRPDVIVYNTGLHLLHLVGHGRDGDGLSAWLRYEATLEGVLRSANESGRVSAVVFKTTNRVCESAYVSPYSRGARLYGRGDRATLARCGDEVRAQNAVDAAEGRFDEVSDEDVGRYCREGTITESGSSGLNARLYGFVAEAGGRYPRLSLRVMNDHDVERCEYTARSDGRHYQAQNLARVRLLGNILTSLG